MDRQSLIENLKSKAVHLRRESLYLMKEMGSGWLGGSFSSADFVTALIYYKMRLDPANPLMEDRDRLVISKAHSCEVYYSALCDAGYFPKEQLSTYSRICSNLQVHADCRTPGVECSGGSLGLGLSYAAGSAMAAYIQPHGKNLSAETRSVAPRYRVYCILGDGECNEGEIWEAAINAAHYRLDNLTAIVDHNKFQSTGSVREKMNIESLAGIFSAFGWSVLEIDGNDMDAVVDALDQVETVKDKPQAIVAHTIKGKGFPELEGANCHFVQVDEALLQKGLEALKA